MSNSDEDNPAESWDQYWWTKPHKQERDENKRPFDLPPAPEGFPYWKRPCYLSIAGREGLPDEVSWRCAFCKQTYEGREHYGQVGFACACGAIVVSHDLHWTVQAKLVTLEWAEGREEVYG